MWCARVLLLKYDVSWIVSGPSIPKITYLEATRAISLRINSKFSSSKICNRTDHSKAISNAPSFWDSPCFKSRGSHVALLNSLHSSWANDSISGLISNPCKEVAPKWSNSLANLPLPHPISKTEFPEITCNSAMATTCSLCIFSWCADCPPLFITFEYPTSAIAWASQ